MIHARQYRPAFFEGFENEEHDVETVQDLLAIPFIHNFTQSRAGKFHRFSIADNVALMAEYDDGMVWWVVAKLKGMPDGALPVWHAPEEALKALQEERAGRVEKGK